MKLENIGFYSLEDERAKNSNVDSALWRNELIITSKCNFNCPYCRGIKINGKYQDMALSEIKRVIDFWESENMQNVRFSGGEPMLHPDINEIVKYTKEKCINIKHIAISTNGYSNLELYKELIHIGVNDYSISLDACCSSVGDTMSGGVNGSWEKVISNISNLSKLTYVTVGMVFDKQNADDMRDSIIFAHELGVADIRIISAAQWNSFEIFENLELPRDILDSHPILKYRLNNFSQKLNVRGIKDTDSRRCGLLIDDMIVKGDYHYPCVIKMREGCKPIGKITDNTVRQDRYLYYKNHNCYSDNICNKNCLDVCIDYNNKFIKYKIESQNKVDRLSEDSFTWELWNSGSVHDFGIKHFRFENLEQHKNKFVKGLLGYCFSDNIKCRPKKNHTALLYEINGNRFWFHIRNNEFIELFDLL